MKLLFFLVVEPQSSVFGLTKRTWPAVQTTTTTTTNHQQVVSRQLQRDQKRARQFGSFHTGGGEIFGR